MKTARVAYGGQFTPRIRTSAAFSLPDGRVLTETDVVWFAAIRGGHHHCAGPELQRPRQEPSKELTITTKDEPLVFLKGPGAVISHRGFTRRPAGVSLHYV